MTEVIIKFTLKIQLIDSCEKIISVNAKHIENIERSIIQNAMTNSSDEIVSSKFGIIRLKKCKIKLIDASNMHFTLKVDVDSEYDGDVGELVWCIMPATYSSDEDDRFKFMMDGKKRCETYILNIMDVPEFV